MPGLPSIIRMLQTLRSGSSCRFAVKTVFQKRRARRKPSAHGPTASILTPISRQTGFRKLSKFAHGASGLVQFDCGCCRSLLAGCEAQTSQPATMTADTARCEEAKRDIHIQRIPNQLSLSGSSTSRTAISGCPPPGCIRVLIKGTSLGFPVAAQGSESLLPRRRHWATSDFRY